MECCCFGMSPTNPLFIMNSLQVVYMIKAMGKKADVTGIIITGVAALKRIMYGQHFLAANELHCLSNENKSSGLPFVLEKVPVTVEFVSVVNFGIQRMFQMSLLLESAVSNPVCRTYQKQNEVEVRLPKGICLHHLFRCLSNR